MTRHVYSMLIRNAPIEELTRLRVYLLFGIFYGVNTCRRSLTRDHTAILAGVFARAVKFFKENMFHNNSSNDIHHRPRTIFQLLGHDVVMPT